LSSIQVRVVGCKNSFVVPAENEDIPGIYSSILVLFFNKKKILLANWIVICAYYTVYT
jgi:hypothetical protein